MVAYSRVSPCSFLVGAMFLALQACSPSSPIADRRLHLFYPAHPIQLLVPSRPSACVWHSRIRVRRSLPLPVNAWFQMSATAHVDHCRRWDHFKGSAVQHTEIPRRKFLLESHLDCISLRVFLSSMCSCCSGGLRSRWRGGRESLVWWQLTKIDGAHTVICPRSGLSCLSRSCSRNFNRVS